MVICSQNNLGRISSKEWQDHLSNYHRWCYQRLKQGSSSNFVNESKLIYVINIFIVVFCCFLIPTILTRRKLKFRFFNDVHISANRKQNILKKFKIYIHFKLILLENKKSNHFDIFWLLLFSPVKFVKLRPITFRQSFKNLKLHGFKQRRRMTNSFVHHL